MPVRLIDRGLAVRAGPREIFFDELAASKDRPLSTADRSRGNIRAVPPRRNGRIHAAIWLRDSLSKRITSRIKSDAA
jgi:hypothetical protein